MGKYKLKGHESFIIREGWLTKGMTAAMKDPKLFSVNSGSDALGVGTNMAKSIRYWMKTAGLTAENNKGVFLTELGKIILDKDPYFEDPFTLWIVHINIAGNFALATSWNLFFNHMNLTSAFSRDEMFEMMRSLVTEYTGEQEPSERSVRDDCSAILAMYSMGGEQNDDPEEKKNSPFEELGLIVRSGNKYLKKRPLIGQIDPLAILYLFLERLNRDKSIPIDALTDEDDMPGKILNLNRIAVNDFLDQLQNGGYIIVNRTAGLDIIYPGKCWEMTKEDVVKKYYERSRKS